MKYRYQFLSALLATASLSSGAAPNGKIHALLKNLDPEQTIDVIVRHRDAPNAVACYAIPGPAKTEPPSNW